MIAKWNDGDFLATVVVNDGAGWRNPLAGELPFEQSAAISFLCGTFFGALIGAFGFFIGMQAS